MKQHVTHKDPNAINQMKACQQSPILITICLPVPYTAPLEVITPFIQHVEKKREVKKEEESNLGPTLNPTTLPALWYRISSSALHKPNKQEKKDIVENPIQNAYARKKQPISLKNLQPEEPRDTLKQNLARVHLLFRVSVENKVNGAIVADESFFRLVDKLDASARVVE